MRVWRLHNPNAEYAKLANFDPLDGHGAAIDPGRWNLEGTPLLYTSSNPAQAVLEVLVHVPAIAFGQRELLELEVPDESLEDASGLVVKLAYGQDERETQALGDAWVQSRRTLALSVPSAPMPIQNNILLNPQHQLMRQVRIVRRVPFSLDPRMV